MRKIFSLFLILLLVTTISSSVYHVAVDDSSYAQLYVQPIEQQPLDTFNNQPAQVEQPQQQTEMKKLLWTSASWSNGNERILISDQKDPYDSQFELGEAGDPVWIIDGNGNAIIDQGSSRGYVFTKNKDVQLTTFVIPSKSIKSISLNVRTNHHIDCGFGGYQSTFSIEEQNVSFKKEVVHGWYSSRLGSISLNDAGLDEWRYDQKVGLRLEAKNIVADNGKEAVQISSYFNEAGDGRVWKKVTEWTDKQDGGISSGLAERDFDTNFKKYQDCKGKGDNMVESREKALAPFLGTADALWIRVNADDSDGNTANNVLLSDITVADIEEEQTQTQIQSQISQQQIPQQILNNQPLVTLNNQMPEKNFEPMVEAPKHNYSPKIDDFLKELQTSLSYQAN
jgi:hypothetical protein